MRGQWGRLIMLVARDAVILGLTLWVWRWSLTVPEVWGPAIAAALLTAVSGYVLHEWGHLIGALLKRCVFELPATPFETFFLFRFNRDQNTRPQFFSMALGGFVSSIITVIALVVLLPWGVLATALALTLTALGVIATLIIEVPEFMRVWRGGPIPAGAAFIKEKPVSE
jgi:hypothetical protein